MITIAYQFRKSCLEQHDMQTPLQRSARNILQNGARWTMFSVEQLVLNNTHIRISQTTSLNGFYMTRIPLSALLQQSLTITTYEAAGLNQKVYEYNLIAALFFTDAASITVLNEFRFMRDSVSAAKRLWKLRNDASCAVYESIGWFALMAAAWRRCIEYAEKHPATIRLATDAVEYGMVFILEEWSFEATEVQLRGATEQIPQASLEFITSLCRTIDPYAA